MSELPDVITESHDDSFLLVANRKARSFLKKRFGGRGPRWSRIEPAGDGIVSPEYRAIEIERAPVFGMILHELHKGGLEVMFQCDSERFMQEAIAADAAPPEHETLQ